MANIGGGRIKPLGTQGSGLRTDANGWNVGASVDAYYDEKLKEDIVVIYVNGGSNGGIQSKCIGSYAVRKGKIVRV